MRRTVTVMALRVKPARKRNPQWHSLDNCGPGIDMLTFVDEMLTNWKADTGVDHAKGRFLTLRGHDKSKRTILVNADVGTFGERGSMRKVTSHAEVHSHGADEAHTLWVRLFFVVPKNSTLALVYVEHVDRRAATKILDELRQRWIAHDYAKDYTLVTEALVLPEVWLQNVELEHVTVTSYGHESDRADLIGGSKGAPLGTLTMRLEPEKGRSHLPKSLLSLLRDKKVNRAKLLGLGIPNKEIDQVKVTVGRDGATKTFVIDNERTPTVRLDLSDAAVDTSDADGFRMFCLEQAPDLYERMGADWQTLHLQ